ncbi:hypothetical protein FRB96_008442 [Tulasnella sp. 330]|nr:hypothetical protein FRB96_008442 [Tulasnella sp. 330]
MVSELAPAKSTDRGPTPKIDVVILDQLEKDFYRRYAQDAQRKVPIRYHGSK